MQKLLELEGIQVKAEEEPEGETIVGSGGTKTSGYGYYIFFKYFFSLFRCICTAAPLVVFYIRNSLVVR